MYIIIIIRVYAHAERTQTDGEDPVVHVRVRCIMETLTRPSIHSDNTVCALGLLQSGRRTVLYKSHQLPPPPSPQRKGRKKKKGEKKGKKKEID